MEVALSRRLMAKAIGTFGFFFLGFSGIAAAVSRPGEILSSGVALGFGGGLALMIFAFGHISGGHFNPAVSAGLAAGGRFPAGEVLPYWAAQMSAGWSRRLSPRRSTRGRSARRSSVIRPSASSTRSWSNWSARCSS